MVKYLKWAYEKLWCLFAIFYWLQNDPEDFSQAYDDWCREELAKGTRFTDIDSYTANFGGRRLWVSNHPYASFHLYHKNLPECTCSRYTKHLMKKRLQQSKEAHIKGVLK